MNEWLAHLCNPQLKSQQFAGPEGDHTTINQKALMRTFYIIINNFVSQAHWPCSLIIDKLISYKWYMV